MGKITFRADDDLLEELEGLEASKSEVMREALRQHLGVHAGSSAGGRSDADAGFEALVADCVDAALDRRLGRRPAPEVNLSITLEGVDGELRRTGERNPRRTGNRESRPTADGHESAGRHEPAERAEEPEGPTCAQCGETVADDHVYCPNCGEKASRRLFCECGDEVRSDWSFCPGCGRRTPAADVLDREMG